MLLTLFIMMLYELVHLLVKGCHLVDFYLMGEWCEPSGGDHREVRLEKRFTGVHVGINNITKILSVDLRISDNVQIVILRAFVIWKRFPCS